MNRLPRPRRTLRGATLAAAMLAVSCAGSVPGVGTTARKVVPASTDPIRPPPAIVLRPTAGAPLAAPTIAAVAPAATPAARTAWPSSLPKPRAPLPEAEVAPPPAAEPVETASMLAPVALPTPLPAEPTPVERPAVPLPTPVVRLPENARPQIPPPAPAFVPEVRKPAPAPTAPGGFPWPWAREAPTPRTVPGRSIPPSEPKGGIIWPWSRSEPVPEPTWTPGRGMTEPGLTATARPGTTSGSPLRVTTAAPPRAPTWTPGLARTPAPLPSPTPEARSDARARPDLLTFTVPLSALGDVEDLRVHPQGRALLSAARQFPDAPILVRAYVTESDTRERHADPGSLSDEIVIQTARYLADRGIDPNRISGKGMGIDEGIGRAIVVTIVVGESPPERPPRGSEIARKRGQSTFPRT